MEDVIEKQLGYVFSENTSLALSISANSYYINGTY